MRLRTYKDPLAEVTSLSLREVLPGLVPNIVLEVYRFGHHRFLNAVLAAQRDPNRRDQIKAVFDDAAAMTEETGAEQAAEAMLNLVGELEREIPLLVRDASGLEMLADNGDPIDGTFRLSGLQGDDREAAEEWLFGQTAVRGAILGAALVREMEFKTAVEGAAKNSSASSRTSAGKTLSDERTEPPAAN